MARGSEQGVDVSAVERAAELIFVVDSTPYFGLIMLILGSPLYLSISRVSVLMLRMVTVAAIRIVVVTIVFNLKVWLKRHHEGSTCENLEQGEGEVSWR